MTIINGKKRGRPGKWILDYRDQTGKRRWITCDTKAEAETERDRVRATLKTRGPFHPTVDPDTTVAQLAVSWLATERIRRTKSQTVDTYARVYRVHVAPVLGACKVRELNTYQLRRFLELRLASGLKKTTVNGILTVLALLAKRAIDEERLLTANPCAGVSEALGLGEKPDPAQVKAFMPAELHLVLGTARTTDPAIYPLFSLLARTAVRIGEAVALRWEDIDWRAGRITVQRTATRRGENSCKSGRSREVDMSTELAAELRRLETQRKAEALRYGWREVPARIFCTRTGHAHEASSVLQRLKRVLKRAKLPGHFNLHSFRHTWASVNLAAGESIEYVSRTLGHRDHRITVQTYGRHLPHGNRDVANRFDALVAKGGAPSDKPAAQAAS